MTTRPARKRKKAKRPALVIDRSLPAPAIVCARADGVESFAAGSAVAAGHACAGYVPNTQKLQPGNLPTPTDYPLQAVKWNVRASQANLIITADVQLFGRARAAREYAERWSKPWLQVWPSTFDATRLREWLRTHAIRVLHVTGPASYQAPAIEAFVTAVMGEVWAAG